MLHRSLLLDHGPHHEAALTIATYEVIVREYHGPGLVLLDLAEAPPEICYIENIVRINGQIEMVHDHNM